MKLRENVIWESLGEQVVVLVMDSDLLFELNDTAALAWHVLIDGGTEDEAIDALTDRYEVTPEDAASAVAQLRVELADRGIVESEYS